MSVQNLIGNFYLVISAYNSDYWSKLHSGFSMQKVYGSNNPQALSMGHAYHINSDNPYLTMGFQEDEVVSSAAASVPEPGVLPLILLGLFGIYLFSQKRLFKTIPYLSVIPVSSR